jgi:hypothetical protein
MKVILLNQDYSFAMISNVFTAELKKILTLTMFFHSQKEVRTLLKTR